jgi:hypothetical protein
MAVSTYPFVNPNNLSNSDPSNIPQNWFTKMANLAPEKPFAVAETGYIAEDLHLETFDLHIKGTAEWQNQYITFMLDQMDRLDAELVVWFCSRDYDQLWPELEQQGVEEMHKTWKDTGLLDGNGRSRPALATWDRWMGYEYRK